MARLPSVASAVPIGAAGAAVRSLAEGGVPQPPGRGRSWALVPSAAGVIDPLLSTGFPLALLGIHRLLDVLERTSAGARAGAALQRVRARHAVGARRDRAPGRRALRDDGRPAAVQEVEPSLFRGSELQRGGPAARDARRLRQDSCCRAHPDFGAGAGRLLAGGDGRHRAGAERDALLDRIDRAIEPFDTAGLLDRAPSRLVSGAGLGSRGLGCEAAGRRSRRSIACSNAAASDTPLCGRVSNTIARLCTARANT